MWALFWMCYNPGMFFQEFIKETILGAGKVILEEEKKLKIEQKASFTDLVTNADKASEEFIISAIKKTFPDHTVLAEESSLGAEKDLENFKKAKYIWIIDPIDGTTNFAHGLPLYSISIALFQKKTAKSSNNFDYLSGELIAGAVYAPRLNELFYAEKGQGAFLNDQPIHVSGAETLKQALTVTGFPYVQKEQNLPYFQTMLFTSQAVRRLGSAALDLCYTAAGRFDVYWEFGLKPWDVAAGALIVEEAGGLVTDTTGGTLDLFGSDILATNKLLHDETLELFDKI